MGLFTRGKRKRDSKGIIGGFAASIGFGIAATQLTHMSGIEVSKAELVGLSDNWTAVSANFPAWAALVTAVVGLWGNWSRKFTLSFHGAGKNPLKSKGIMGNVLAFGAGIWAFSEAIHADQEAIKELFGEAESQWKIVAPAVLGIAGAAQGFWGRWRAKSTIEPSRDALLEGCIATLIAINLGTASCASNPDNVAVRNAELAGSEFFGPQAGYVEKIR